MVSPSSQRDRGAKDKPKVEGGVRFAQTYLLGRLRHQTFLLTQANEAIGWKVGFEDRFEHQHRCRECPKFCVGDFCEGGFWCFRH
ncbi:hypothetical protein ACVMIH_007549 [Bradyrhizobium sp. USDA 4503]